MAKIYDSGMIEKDIDEELDEEDIEGDKDTDNSNHNQGVQSIQSVQVSEAEMKRIHQREMSKKVPGWGFLFHVEEEFLPEVTRLNEQAIFGFAARDMQQAVLDPNRTQSAWDIFKNRFMRYNFSFDGLGREQAIQLHQLTQDEKEAAMQGGLYDKGQ